MIEPKNHSLAIFKYENWGPLKANKQGLQQIDAFRRTLRNFESYLASAQNNIEGAVTLKTSSNESVNKIDEFKVEELAKDAEFVKEVETIVLEWSHQIEQVKFILQLKWYSKSTLGPRRVFSNAKGSRRHRPSRRA